MKRSVQRNDVSQELFDSGVRGVKRWGENYKINTCCLGVFMCPANKRVWKSKALFSVYCTVFFFCAISTNSRSSGYAHFSVQCFKWNSCMCMHLYFCCYYWHSLKVKKKSWLCTYCKVQYSTYIQYRAAKWCTYKTDKRPTLETKIRHLSVSPH